MIFHHLKPGTLQYLQWLRQLAYVAVCSFVFFVLPSCKKESFVTQEPVHPQSTVRSAAVGSVNGVMMQAFYWDVPKNTPAGSWWQNLASKADELSKAGFTALWLPPPYKGGSSNDVGYGVYDRYDLGEFNQKGSIPTRYGTLGQLQGAVSALHGKNIQVYADIVMNHLTWADYQQNVNGNNVWTGFSYTGRNNTYSAYKWNQTLFNGYQGANNQWFQWNAWDFSPYNSGDAFDNLLGCEIRYKDNPSAVNETISWGNWITSKLDLDGYRLDATKHMYTPFVNQWLDNVKGSRFAVGEAWFNNVQWLQDYAQATGGRMSLFDVPLHYTFNAMSNGNGSWDMRGLQFAGFTEANGPLSVSFVENHDTEHLQGALYSPVINLKMLAYAYILTREKGYPCVFYRDYYEYGLGGEIKKLIEIRKNHAYGSGFEYTSVNDADVYVYSRAGDATHAGLLLMLNDGNSQRTKTITTPFKNATLVDMTGNASGTVTTNGSGTGTFPVNGRSYSVWVPATPNRTGQTNVTFTITYSDTQPGQDLYIVGSTPELGAWNPANARPLSTNPWPAWTATLPLTTGTFVEYKYIRKDQAGNVLWEPGPNKTFTPQGGAMTRNDTW